MKSLRWFVGMLVLGGAVIVQAQAAQTAADPREIVEGRYNSLLQLIEDGVLVPGLSNDALLELMEQELSPVIDFARVSRKVMGKYARRASEKQLTDFSDIFKETLVSTYSKGLDEIDQLDRVIIDDPVFDPEGDRAKIPSEIVLNNGKRYKVIYSMFREGGKWQIENMVVEGVNIGLVYRNQFAHYMETYNLDIDKVLLNWGK